MLWRSAQLAGVKLIFMLRLLILARLLSPEDFGLLAIAVTAVGFLLGVTDIGMIPALVQGRDIDEQQYDAAWTVGLTRALLVVGCVVIAAPLIARIFAEPRATDIIRVLAIRPLLDSAASIKIADLTRMSDPDVGLVTNVRAAHLESFGSLDDIAAAKGEVFAVMRADAVTVVVSYEPRRGRRRSIRASFLVTE